jgi:hypothetical protein
MTFIGRKEHMVEMYRVGRVGSLGRFDHLENSFARHLDK